MNSIHFPYHLVLFIGYALGVVHLSVAIYLAYLVKMDREKIQNTIGTEVILTLGPLRWGAIVFLTGGLGLALYWFQTYHPVVLKKYFTQKKE